MKSLINSLSIMKTFVLLLRFRFPPLAFFILMLPFTALAQREVPELWGTRVHDEAKVLKQQTIDKLEQSLKAYEDSTSNQIAILIVNTIGDETIETFGIRVA